MSFAQVILNQHKGNHPALSRVWTCTPRHESTASSRVSTLLASPAGIREQWVLTPLCHIAMVIAVVHSLWAVVSSQMGRRGILSWSGAAPLAERLLWTVGAVNVVSNHPWLAGLAHSHVEHPSIILRAWEVVLRGAVRGTGFMHARLWGLVVRDSGDVRSPGSKAVSSWSAAWAGGGGWRFPILMHPREREEDLAPFDSTQHYFIPFSRTHLQAWKEAEAGTSCSLLYMSLASTHTGESVLIICSLSAPHGE